MSEINPEEVAEQVERLNELFASPQAPKLNLVLAKALDGLKTFTTQVAQAEAHVRVLERLDERREERAATKAAEAEERKQRIRDREIELAVEQEKTRRELLSEAEALNMIETKGTK